jgi:GNAT superfamily N-acetyltransferase
LFDPLTPQRLHEKVWGEADFRHDLTWGIASNGRLVGFIMGVIRQRIEGPCGYIKLLVVEASCRGGGLGSQLLNTVEGRMRQEGVEVVRVCESSPNYLTPGLDVRYTQGACFFETHGYRRLGATYSLKVDLTADDFLTIADEVRLARRGFRVRRAETVDYDRAMALLQQYWPPWRAEVHRAFTNEPITLHLALQNGQLLGFAAYDCNNVGLAWFGPMGTVPAVRGQGLGGVLLRRCLRDHKAQGHDTAIIPWVGPVGFYARFAGARIDRVFYRYEKHLAEGPLTPMGKQHVVEPPVARQNGWQCFRNAMQMKKS